MSPVGYNVQGSFLTHKSGTSAGMAGTAGG